MGRRNDRACQNCYYWTEDKKSAPLGICVSAPPVPMALSGVNGIRYELPRTDPLFFCGCWEPKAANDGVDDFFDENEKLMAENTLNQALRAGGYAPAATR